MFKLLVTLVIFESARAGFLNLAQNNDNSRINSNNPSGNYAFQQQVPLTLSAGPSHQSYSAQVSSNQQPSNGQIATSTTYRQQHVNSVPSTVTTHGIATSYITVPVRGYYGNDARNNGNNANNNSPANGISSNSVGNGEFTGTGNFGYGGYGYSYSSAIGNVSPSNNQDNNGAGHPYVNNQNNQNNQNQNQNQNQNTSNGYSH